MDFISIEKGENLFWLGRYVERVYRTLNYLEGLYDVLIDTTTVQNKFERLTSGPTRNINKKIE